MKRGLFITFEGSDGSGKTTQIQLLKDFLEKKGYSPIITREPGGTRISEYIRDIILDQDNSEMSNVTEMLLYAASRAQHVDEFIRPNLESGKIVISDRFVDSSYVYQGNARNLGDIVDEVNRIAVRDCMPDATFLLIANPEIGYSRVANRALDRIELEGLDYQKLVFKGYKELVSKYPDRIHEINADDSVSNIQNVINEKILKLIEQYESDIDL